MKRVLLLCLFLLPGIFLDAQSAAFGNFSIGYNASFLKPDNFNYVIRRYNQTRSWLSKEMPELKYTDGLFLDMQFCDHNLMLDFNYNRRVSVLSAQGDPGTGSGTVQRDVRFKAGTYGMGIGLNLTPSPPYIGFGFDFDIGGNKMETRVGDPASIKDVDYDEVYAPLTVGSSIWAQVLICGSKSGGLGLMLRPYYHFDFTDHEYSYLNEAINPYTYQNDPESLRDKLNHFGLNVALTLHFE